MIHYTKATQRIKYVNFVTRINKWARWNKRFRLIYRSKIKTHENDSIIH